MTIRRIVSSAGIFVAFSFLFLCAAGAQADAYSWDPGATSGSNLGGSGTWDTTGPWWYSGSGDQAWVNNATPDSAVFAASAGTVTIGAPITVNSLTFNVSGYTLSGPNAITLDGSTPTITVTNAADSAEIDAQLAGTAGLTVAGPGTLTLGAYNSYTGPTNVNGGILALDVYLGNTLSAASAVTINSGGTIRADNDSPFGTVTWPMVTVNPGGLLTTSNGIFSWTPVLNLAGGTLAAGTPTESFGSWVFGSDVTVSGATTSTMSARDMSLSEPGGVNFTVGTGSTLNVTGEFSAVGGNTGLIKQGLGTMILSGPNTYTGPTVVNAGILALNSAFGTLSAGSPVTINSGGTIRADANSPFGTTSWPTVTVYPGGLLTTSNGIFSWAPVLTLAGGTLAAGTPDGYFGSWLFNSNVTVGGSTTSTMSATDMSLSEAGGVHFTVGAGSTLNVTGGFWDGQGNTGLIKQGPGTMIFSGANAYTATFLQEGTIALGVTNALAINASLTFGAVGTSGTLDLAGYNQELAGLTVAGGATASGQVIGNSSTGSSSILTYGYGNNSSTFAGTIQDTLPGGNQQVALTVVGGLLNLGGANTYSGNTTLNAGTLQIGNALALQNSTVVAAGGGLDLNGFDAAVGGLSGAGALTLTSGTLNVGNNGANTTYGGNLGGTAALVKTGSGTLTLSAGNWYTGPTVVNAGILALNSAFGTLSAGSPVTINSGGTVRADADSPFGTVTWPTVTVNAGGLLTTSDGIFSWAPVLNLAGGTLAAGAPDLVQWFGSWLFNCDVAVGGSTTSTMSATDMSLSEAGGVNFTVGAGSTLNVTGGFWAVQGNTGLIKQGPGTMILSGANSYTGPTTINGGTLQIGAGGSGEFLASPSIAMSNNATVAFNHSDTLDYSGAISGSGQLVKAGSGRLTLGGTNANTYSGATTISAGTLALDYDNRLATATALTIASSGVLDLAGNAQTVGSLSGSAGAIVANSAPAYLSTLTVNPVSGAMTFAGNIIGNTLLALSGSGALTLSGTNAYTGGTTVSGGTLEIAAPSALAGSGLVTIAAGGRLVLGSGAGIGALLAASSPVGSGAAALSAAASIPATMGGYASASESMATLGGAPVSSQGGAGSVGGSSTAAVPEPGTIALLATGVLMLAVARWRRRG